MKTIKKMPLNLAKTIKKKRVAAYVRVSKDTDRMHHSIGAQISYYNRLIQSKASWDFAGMQELKELFAGNGMVGYVMKERVDGRLILPEAVQIMKMKGTASAGN